MFDAEHMPGPVRCATWQEEIKQHPWPEFYLTHQAGAAFTVGADSHNNLGLSDLELRQIKATYFGTIAEVDAQVGRLLNHLKETGSYNNTMIIFTSDHGENLGDHWAHSKFTYFEETFHVPLIVRDPSREADQTRGSIIEAFTEGVDLMPTILDAIGGDIPAQCDGHSLLPFCHGSSPNNWRQESHMEFDLRSPYDNKIPPPLGLAMQQCMATIIRGERYKYVHFTALPPLLFDLQEDPDEFHNLADDPACQDIRIEYAEKLLSWRMEHDEPALTDLGLLPDGSVEYGVRG